MVSLDFENFGSVFFKFEYSLLEMVGPIDGNEKELLQMDAGSLYDLNFDLIHDYLDIVFLWWNVGISLS